MTDTHHMGHLTGGQILRNSIMKLFFEGMGTMFFTMAFNISQKLLFNANQVACLLVLWVLTIFGLKISGAHYNPAVSFAYMLRKDAGKFPRILGFAYIGAQIAGAFLGAMVSWFLLVNDHVFIGKPTSGLIYPNWSLDGGRSGYVFSNMIAETLGTFFVTFFYLT